MLATVQGKVWEIEARPEELNELRGKYLETGLLRAGNLLKIRVAADRVDHPKVRSIEPNLEDAYIWLMREPEATAS